jgi:hypothetical protein
MEALGLDPWTDFDVDDEDDDGPPDPVHERYSQQIDRAFKWALGTTYALVVVPLFVITLID